MKLDYRYKGKRLVLDLPVVPAFVCVGGSHAYGTNHAKSDLDLRGVYRAWTPDTFRLQSPQETIDRQEPDIVLHELRKFCKLAAAANPSVLEALWAETIGHVSKTGAVLRENRKLFLSTKVRKTYGGYARSQMEKAVKGTGGSRGQAHLRREKFLLHTMRLMQQGLDILRDGDLTLKVADPEYLWWAAERGTGFVEKIVADQDARMDLALKNTPLPDEPDYEAIDQMLIRLRMQ